MMFHQSDFRNDSEHSSQNDNNDFQYKAGSVHTTTVQTANIIKKKKIQGTILRYTTVGSQYAVQW